MGIRINLDSFMIFQPTFWHCLSFYVAESALSNKRRSVLFDIYTHGGFLPDLEVCEYQKSPFSVDRNVMVNFKPGEYMRKIFFSVSDTGSAEEQIRVLSIGVEPMNFRFLVQRDTLLQSYSILLEAKTTKLGSCNKHPGMAAGMSICAYAQW